MSDAARAAFTSPQLLGEIGALRYCVSLSHYPWTRDTEPRAAVARTIETVRQAEAAGIESCWLSEDPEGWDAFGVLGALARETERIRLGPGVANPYLRHPNLLAASVATLDHLSGGRAFLGLGRGQTEWYERALGIPTGNPVDVLEETFDLLGQWWRPPHRATAADTLAHFRVRDWERSIGPVQTRPRPPVYLAAAGPKALDIAARHADGVLFNDLASIEYLERAIGRVRATAREAGRDPERLAFFVRGGVTVTDNPEPVLERKKATIALIQTLPLMDRLIETPAFDVAAIIAEVRRVMRTEEILRRGGGFPALRKGGDLRAARAAIPTELMDHLAIVGSLDHVRNRLGALAAIGATHVFVDRNDG